MTTKQAELIHVLTTDRKIDAAAFNGDFLNCRVDIRNKATGKVKPQKFSLVFDDAAELEGARVLFQSCKGAYSESFARDAFFESLRIGVGEAEAVKFANECREGGVRIGCSQQWLDANAALIAPIAD
jgi:hypothetical protein